MAVVGRRGSCHVVRHTVRWRRPGGCSSVNLGDRDSGVLKAGEARRKRRQRSPCRSQLSLARHSDTIGGSG
ncbi:hypothetical protein E4U44_000873 [Claviceps purpurea]|nr:hypothetical protein E4U44_000873 [Claviceps purpurea]